MKVSTNSYELEKITEIWAEKVGYKRIFILFMEK